RNRATITVPVTSLKRALLDVFGAVDGKSIARGPTNLAHRLRNLREVAGEHPYKVRRLCHFVGEAKFTEKKIAVRDVLGVFYSCRFYRNIVPRKNLPRHIVNPV